MKYNLKYIGITLSAILLSFTSCQKDFLDRKPLHLLSEAIVWEDPLLIKFTLNEMYTFMQTGFATNYLPAAITDDIQVIGAQERDIVGYLTGDFFNSRFPGRNLWRDLYVQIRKVNYFLERAETAAVLTDEERTVLMGQARFLRAYLYFQLFSHFKDAPLITKAQSSEQAEEKPHKTSLEDGIAFVDSELLKAAEELPQTYDDEEWGRITKHAALAYRSRVLLWAASPLANETKDPQKWKAAYEAAQLVMDAEVYKLQGDYNAPFLTKNVKTLPEVILEYRYNGTASQRFHGFDRNNASVGFGGRGYNCPTQQIVDAYEMTNGLLITEAGSGYDPANPYADRDPRFAKNIVYNGSTFKNRSVALFVGGVDQPTAAASPTGYYVRKFIDEKFDYMAITSGGSSTNWVIMRYAEVLLNYAEAKNEVDGPTTEVYDAIKLIRDRVNMPELPSGLSKEEMRERILRERRVELAFEDNIRYNDLKRLKLAETVLNGDVNGVTTRRLADETFTYTPKKAGSRVFTEKNYWFPIPLTELGVNTNLEPQNPGW